MNPNPPPPPREYQFTKANAKEMQLRGVAARKKNAAEVPAHMILVNAIRKAFNAKIQMTPALEKMLDELEVPHETHHRVKAVDLAVVKAVRNMVDNGDVESLNILGKIAGLHHDQTPEGRGGEQNPVHEEIVFRMA